MTCCSISRPNPSFTSEPIKLRVGVRIIQGHSKHILQRFLQLSFPKGRLTTYLDDCTLGEKREYSFWWLWAQSLHWHGYSMIQSIILAPMLEWGIQEPGNKWTLINQAWWNQACSGSISWVSKSITEIKICGSGVTCTLDSWLVWWELLLCRMWSGTFWNCHSVYPWARTLSHSRGQWQRLASLLKS